MSTTVFFGNLVWECQNEDLQSLLADHNPVDVNVMVGRNGRSRGYALVTFGYSLCQWELTGILRLPSFLLLLLGSAAFELAVSSKTVRNLGFFERTS